MQRGLIPCGSLAPISLSFVAITIAKLPLTACIASTTALSIPLLAPLAINVAITSESIVVWNTCPPSSNKSLITSALTRLPLWAIAIWPSFDDARSGCAFSTLVDPVVEYLTWPIAICPFNLFKSSFVKASVIKPNPLWISTSVPFPTAIPADSCPLCWSAYNP